jgi:GNAT superfamily N-acetyltransferase
MLADLDLSTESSATTTITLRRATPEDLDQIIALLSDDAINASRGDIVTPADRLVYESAFRAVTRDPANDVIVAVDGDETVIGTLQLTRIPGMVRRGATRLLVEAVFVARPARSTGIGTILMRWVLDTAAPSVGADLVQLTSATQRADAHRFNERLGFKASHVGFKFEMADVS